MADIRDYDDIYEYARDQMAENEAFVGDVLDKRKMEKLDRMKYFCRELVKAEPSIEYKESLLDNWSRHGTVILHFPDVLFVNSKRATEIMRSLFATADSFGVSSLGEDIIISFNIYDMWSEFHYDYNKK